MNIFIVNHSVKNCGVYQYGKRFGNIMSKSKKYNFIYLEINSNQEFNSLLEEHNPKVIIYNYLSGTMPWLNENIVSNNRKKGIKQFLIIHNTYYSFFDYYLHQNPYHDLIDSKNFRLCRPLFDYNPSESLENKNSESIKIGTFGFGFSVKKFDELCSIVNEQFYNKKVDLRIHITESHFGKSNISFIENSCMNRITSPNIKVHFTNNFISDQEILDFLYQNNLNIFLYEDYKFYNGISSTIDYALSVKKPMAICKSNMFSHILDVTPSICVENNSLEEIMKNGFEPLIEKYNSWVPDKFIQNLEQIITSVLRIT